jgi:hypothetical protein
MKMYIFLCAIEEDIDRRQYILKTINARKKSGYLKESKTYLEYMCAGEIKII